MAKYIKILLKHALKNKYYKIQNLTYTHNAKDICVSAALKRFILHNPLTFVFACVTLKAEKKSSPKICRFSCR